MTNEMTNEEARDQIVIFMCDEQKVINDRDKQALEMAIKALEQEPETGQYEKHIDHTDCIWYGSDSGCPVTCSQYRDGWNDAMDYIFKNGKGYQPYRHDD